MPLQRKNTIESCIADAQNFLTNKNFWKGFSRTVDAKAYVADSEDGLCDSDPEFSPKSDTEPDSIENPDKEKGKTRKEKGKRAYKPRSQTKESAGDKEKEKGKSKRKVQVELKRRAEVAGLALPSVAVDESVKESQVHLVFNTTDVPEVKEALENFLAGLFNAKITDMEVSSGPNIEGSTDPKKEEPPKEGSPEPTVEGTSEKKDIEVSSDPQIERSSDDPIKEGPIKEDPKKEDLGAKNRIRVGLISNQGQLPDGTYNLEGHPFSERWEDLMPVLQNTYGEGANWEEYYQSVLGKALEMKWPSDGEKVVILIGSDASVNGLTSGVTRKRYEQVVARLNLMGIQVYAFNHSQLDVVVGFIASL